MRGMRNILGVAFAVLLLGGAVAAIAAVSAVSQDTALAKKYEKTPSAIKIAPIGKKIPKGKRIALMTCAISSCTLETNAAAVAAKDIGWTTQTFENPLTPEGYVSAWQQMLATHPAAVVALTGLPDSLITSELATAKSEHIPVVEIAPSNTEAPSAAGPVIAAYVNVNQFKRAGQLEAYYVVGTSNGNLADQGGSPVVAYAEDPTFASSAGEQYVSAVHTLQAAGGDVDSSQISLQNIGKTIPGQMVSYVQSHPHLQYLLAETCATFIGVPQALSSAAVGANVKLVCTDPTVSDVAAIHSGQEAAAVAEEADTGGWRAIDALIRYFVHDPIANRLPTGTEQIVTSNSSVQIVNGAVGTPGDPNSFLKAWGLKK